MEDKDKRVGWLRELKLGSEIAIECGSYGYKNYRIDKIEKITPTGRIIVGSTTYDSEGREMGKSGSWSRSWNLTPITQEIINYMRKSELYSRVKNLDWSKVSLEKLEVVVKTLEL